MHIEVTNHNIAQGTANNCWYCPVAQAIREQLGAGHRVEIEASFIRIDDRLYDTPMYVKHFIWAFDRGEHPGPIAFNLA